MQRSQSAYHCLDKLVRQMGVEVAFGCFCNGHYGRYLRYSEALQQNLYVVPTCDTCGVLIQ